MDAMLGFALGSQADSTSDEFLTEESRDLLDNEGEYLDLKHKVINCFNNVSEPHKAFIVGNAMFQFFRKYDLVATSTVKTMTTHELVTAVRAEIQLAISEKVVRLVQELRDIVGSGKDFPTVAKTAIPSVAHLSAFAAFRAVLMIKIIEAVLRIEHFMWKEQPNSEKSQVHIANNLTQLGTDDFQHISKFDMTLSGDDWVHFWKICLCDLAYGKTVVEAVKMSTCKKEEPEDEDEGVPAGGDKGVPGFDSATSTMTLASFYTFCAQGGDAIMGQHEEAKNMNNDGKVVTLPFMKQIEADLTAKVWHVYRGASWVWPYIEIPVGDGPPDVLCLPPPSQDERDKLKFFFCRDSDNHKSGEELYRGGEIVRVAALFGWGSKHLFIMSNSCVDGQTQREGFHLRYRNIAGEDIL